MSSHEMRISSAGRPLSPGAVAVMLMLCLSWGFNQIAVKLALPDIPPMLQATIRSAGALPVLLLIARLRGVRVFKRDGTLRAGLFAGVLFGIEFVLIFRGLLFTSASRGVVFNIPRRFSSRSGRICFLANCCAPRNGAVLHCASQVSRWRSAFPRPMSMQMCCWAT